MMNHSMVFVLLLCGSSWLEGAFHRASPFALVESPAVPSTTTTHIESSHGYQIDLPAGWEVHRDVHGADVVAFSPLEGVGDPFREYISVVVVPLEANVPATKYFQARVKSIQKRYPDLKFSYQKIRDVDGESGLELVYHYLDDTLPLKVWQVIILHDKSEYTISCYGVESDFVKYQYPFRDALSSFRFTAAAQK